MLALALPAVATTLLGALGTVRGMTETVPEATLEPAVLVALTEQVYVVPLVRLETVIGLAVPVPVLVVDPVTHEAVYDLMVAPPLEVGAVKAMLAVRLPAVALPMVGAPGTVTAPKTAELRPAKDKNPKVVK